MDIKKYFIDAEEEMNEQYLSYSGDDTDFDDDFSFDAGAQAPAPAMGGAPTSQPYILTLTNSSAATISSVVIGKAYQNITSAGNGIDSNVVISMGVSGTTYLEYLYTTLNRPFVNGLTYIDGSTAGQSIKALQLKVRDVNGNIQEKTLVPIIDPYQQQTTIVALRTVFKWDGFTSIAVDVNATASTTLYFYPSENVNVGRGLSGQAVARAYGNPNIVRQDKVVLGRGVANALKG
tara:strand:+ start:11366 stop:12067 length:702 start_codon:yes stop_codon:yes gene_type:complete